MESQYKSDQPPERIYESPSVKERTIFETIIWMFFEHKGRVNRKPYIWCFVFMNLFFGIIYHLIGADALETTPGKVLFYAHLAATFSLSLKRAQDLNFSWKWLLLIFIPLVKIYCIIVLVFFKGTIGANKYGLDPLEGKHVISDKPDNKLEAFLKDPFGTRDK